MTANHTVTRCWGVVPAAGIGSRMDAEIPKQYLSLGTSTVLEQTLGAMLEWGLLDGIMVALHPDDRWWPTLAVARNPLISTVHGGKERSDSVLAALDALLPLAAADDWVLVHDAARPCVARDDVRLLHQKVCAAKLGGLLALPVAETVKRSGADGQVLETLDRGELWLAQTPQMFRLGELHSALSAAIEAGATITDEAAAMEWSGEKPLLVPGQRGNIKITRPEDLALAAHTLATQAAAEAGD